VNEVLEEGVEEGTYVIALEVIEGAGDGLDGRHAIGGWWSAQTLGMLSGWGQGQGGEAFQSGHSADHLAGLAPRGIDHNEWVWDPDERGAIAIGKEQGRVWAPQAVWGPRFVMAAVIHQLDIWDGESCDSTRVADAPALLPMANHHDSSRDFPRVDTCADAVSQL
jgi:hypothetical protein